VNVRVRAVILRDGKLVVSRERRRGLEQLFLPGGRVRDRESIAEALVREVAEEVGITVVAERLVYVAEVVASYGAHDLNLIWLAEPRDHDQAIDEHALIALDSPLADSIMPPIAARIAADARAGWPQEPAWLGNIRRAPAQAGA
jgi:8-oxo-dGTP pyrophosphatase MutT (NUDIX family)